MALGLVARADDTGLGNQSLALHSHLRPAKTLIVDLDGLSQSGKNLKIHPERFGHGEVEVVRGIPSLKRLKSWLNGLQAVLTVETPYNYGIYNLARERGIRTVLMANFELLDYLQPGAHQNHYPDVIGLASAWNLDRAVAALGDRAEVIHLPMPVPEHWARRTDQPPVARQWLHVVGYPALADRNGTKTLLESLRHVKSEITMTLTCQKPGWLGSLIYGGVSPPNVTLVIETSDYDRWQSLYVDRDALVMPRRYGGLCLPVSEALAAGIPAVMTDIEPNRSWLPVSWLVDSHHQGTIETKTSIDIYRADVYALARRIDELSTNEQVYADACDQARHLAQHYGWESLMPKFQAALSL